MPRFSRFRASAASSAGGGCDVSVNFLWMKPSSNKLTARSCLIGEDRRDVVVVIEPASESDDNESDCELTSPGSPTARGVALTSLVSWIRFFLLGVD